MKRSTSDEKEFNELFERYRRRVYASAYRMTGNREDALDVVQEVFVKVYQNLARLRGVRSQAAWIRRVTNNICIDRIRRKERRVVRRAGALERRPERDPADALHEKEIRVCVEDALDRLSPIHRAAILLWWQNDLSYKQIAEVMGCSVGTVMSRLHYARRYMRRHLSATVAV